VKPHIFSTLFCEFVLILPRPCSTVTTTSQLFAALLRPSQLFTLLATFSTALKSFHLFPPQLNYFHLFTPLLNSSQRLSTLSPLLNSSHLVSTLLTSFRLFLRSTHLTSFSAHVNSSHLLSPCQLFSTLPTSFHRDAVHRASFYTQKLLHRDPFS
jgi:hypothetical protein